MDAGLFGFLDRLYIFVAFAAAEAHLFGIVADEGYAFAGVARGAAEVAGFYAHFAGWRCGVRFDGGCSQFFWGDAGIFVGSWRWCRFAFDGRDDVKLRGSGIDREKLDTDGRNPTRQCPSRMRSCCC